MLIKIPKFVFSPACSQLKCGKQTKLSQKVNFAVAEGGGEKDVAETI